MKRHFLPAISPASFIEEIEGKFLFSFVAKIAQARTNTGCLKQVIALAKLCMTAVEANFPAATVRGEHVNIRANTRNPEAAQRANEYLARPGSAGDGPVFTGAQAYRLYRSYDRNCMAVMGVLRKHILHSELSLAELAEKYHGEFRHNGRPVGQRRLIGTTLLVKGLEFDHAIVIDAASLSKKELYVALNSRARGH